MAKHGMKGGSRSKEIRAWGIRRREVDINQLALAYYLLARIRLEEQRKTGLQAADGEKTETDASNAHGLTDRAGDQPEAA